MVQDSGRRLGCPVYDVIVQPCVTLVDLLEMYSHLVQPGGVVRAVVASVGPLAKVHGGNVPFDFVLPSEGQRTVVTRIRPLPVMDRVDVTADLECKTVR